MTIAPAGEVARKSAAINLVLWAIILLHVLAPILLSLFQGAMLYTIRGILIFFAIGAAIGTIFENSGGNIGFPDGRLLFSRPVEAR